MDGKKTYLCALGFGLSMVGVAACYYVGLIDIKQAATLLTFFGGVFGGGGLAALRAGVGKG